MILSTKMKLIESVEYSEYGERKNSIAKKTEFGYNGEEHTIDGMQDLRARVYDPKTGVFLQQDSIGGNIQDPLSQNLTLYCLNNPLKYEDPSGHKAMLNQDLGGSTTNTLSSKTTIRPSNPTASSVSVIPNRAVAPSVNTSRGSVVSQLTTSVSVNISGILQSKEIKQVNPTAEELKQMKQSSEQLQEKIIQSNKALTSKLKTEQLNYQNLVQDAFFKALDKMTEGRRVHATFEEKIKTEYGKLPTEDIITEQSLKRIFRDLTDSKLRPDVLIWNKLNSNYYVYEIKSDTMYGHNAGPKQLSKYVNVINLIDGMIGYAGGNLEFEEWLRENNTLQVGEKSYIITHINGVIYYHSNSDIRMDVPIPVFIPDEIPDLDEVPQEKPKNINPIAETGILTAIGEFVILKYLVDRFTPFRLEK